jgi:hypothetical protein
MYTRASFVRQRDAVRRADRRHGRVLAAVAVGLGIGQLALMRWLQGHVPHGTAVAIEGAVFLGYSAAVLWLLLRRQAALGAAYPACPACGARLKGMSERVASATGRCDACGGQVLETTA